MFRSGVKVRRRPEPQSSPIKAVEGPVLRLFEAAPDRHGWGAGDAPVSFDLAAGDAHFLVGPRGAGKSRFLLELGMGHPPRRGSVTLFGQDLARIRPTERWRLRRGLGVVMQTPRLVEDLSIRENLELALIASERSPRDCRTDADEVLAWVGLKRRVDSPAADLDMEGRRRLELARAVINRPNLLLVDEPDGGRPGPIVRLLAGLAEAGEMAMLIATRSAAFARGAGAPVTWVGAAPETAA